MSSDGTADDIGDGATQAEPSQIKEGRSEVEMEDNNEFWWQSDDFDVEVEDSLL